MEEFEDYFDDEPRMESEVKAFERAGPSGKLAEMLSTTLNVGDDEKKGREAISPEDRFLINVDALARRLINDGVARLSETDINNMLEKTNLIPGLKYKNATAYVLGYIASEGGHSLKVDTVKSVINVTLPKLGDDIGVEGPDVVRYARYWKEFL